MSADMKAAMELCRLETASAGYRNLKAAFLELYDESRRWENVFDAQTSELRGLRQQVEQERKARENARGAELQWEKMYYEQFERAAESAIAYQATVNECKLANRRAAELQARLDRVKAETTERCVNAVKDVTESPAIRQCVKAIRALAAAGGQESAAVEDK